jgi:hypothetical protein
LFVLEVEIKISSGRREEKGYLLLGKLGHEFMFLLLLMKTNPSGPVFLF